MKKSLLLVGLIATQAPLLHGATVAVNLTNLGFAATKIEGAENTNAVNALLGITSPTWQNIGISSNNGADLNAPNGVDTSLGTVNLKYHAKNGFLGGAEGVSGSNDASQQLFRIYLDDGDAGSGYAAADAYGVTLQLSNLTTFLANNSATGYTISLLYATDTSAATFRPAQIRSGLLTGANNVTDLTLLTTTGTPTVLANGGYGPLDSTVGGAGNGGGTRGYITSSVLTADQITIAVPTGAGNIRGTIAGFVINSVPEPSSFALLGLSALGLLRRKR